MKRESLKVTKPAITAVGSYVPNEVLTNQDLEGMVETKDEWIRARTGIIERRIAKNPAHSTGYLATQAAKNLLSKNNINPLTIDLILVATVTPDVHVSSTAPYVASQIGADNAFAFDLQAACSGFLYGMSTAAAFIASNQYQRVLLIGADKMSSIIDYTDRTTCIIFGDGAGAALFEPSSNSFGFEGSLHGSDGVGREYLSIAEGGSLHPISATTYSQGGHYVRQEGKTVFKYAVKHMAEASEAIIKKFGLTHHDINYVLPHQANQRIIDATTSRIGINKKKVLVNIHKYGNTTAATLPLLLSDFESQFKKGDKLVFTAFGGGFTWGATYLTWNYDYKN
ncbi:MAG: beta-ketoacyl-ACP synthase III [Flavobacteriaceae bacterium]